jgi:hypothetical protein
MRGLRRRLDRLENPAGKFPFKDMLCVYSADEVAACRAWWQERNAGISDDRLLIIISPLPRKDNAEPAPWEIQP